MLPYVTETSRLILHVEREFAAEEVLRLYLRNKDCFDSYEPTRPFDFYTPQFHENALRREFKAFTMGMFARYFMFLQEDPYRIVGSVNFNFKTEEEPFAEIGYKLDQSLHRQGLMREALIHLIPILHRECGFNRFDARICPTNTASVRLAEGLGFAPFHFEPKSANILGVDVDVMRYSLRLDGASKPDWM